MKTIRRSLLLFTALLPAMAPAIVVGPYTPDANTVFLFHLDEAALATTTVNAGGTIAAGTNAVTFRTNGATASSANLTTDTTTVTNGIGVDMNKNGAFNLNQSSSAMGDTLANASLILGANNSFTLEALINLPDLNAGNREIICSDNNLATGSRGFQFRISNGNLELNTQPGVNAAANDFTVAIPTAG